MKFTLKRKNGGWIGKWTHGTGMGSEIHLRQSKSIWYCLRLLTPANIIHVYGIVKWRNKH